MPSRLAQILREGCKAVGRYCEGCAGIIKKNCRRFGRFVKTTPLGVVLILNHSPTNSLLYSQASRQTARALRRGEPVAQPVGAKGAEC